MNFHQRKFILAVSIMVPGMLFAYVWYWFQGLMENNYPYNTFLFLPNVRFSDFTNSFQKALYPNPYLLSDAPYPPVAYLILRPFARIHHQILFALMLGILPTIWLLYRALKPLLVWFVRSLLGKWAVPTNPKLAPLHQFIIDPVLAVVLTVILLGSCEPYITCLDRGSNELWVVFLLGASLYCFSKARYYTSAALLVIPICMKIYPAVLLTLYVRRGKLRFIVGTLLAAAALTAYGYYSFGGGILHNMELNRQQLSANADYYIIANWGLGQTASAWNLYRVTAITIHAISTGTFFDQRWNWYPLEPGFKAALPVYSAIVAVVAFFVCIYSILLEKDVLRRVVALLLFMVISSPSGAEHKITHIGAALVAFIFVRNRRSGDYIITALLAFTLIPKREYIMECLGPSDSSFMDASAALVLNPLSMLVALIILCSVGCTNTNLTWTRQRIYGLLTGLIPGRARPESPAA